MRCASRRGLAGVDIPKQSRWPRSSAGPTHRPTNSTARERRAAGMPFNNWSRDQQSRLANHAIPALSFTIREQPLIACVCVRSTVGLLYLGRDHPIVGSLRASVAGGMPISSAGGIFLACIQMLSQATGYEWSSYLQSSTPSTLPAMSMPITEHLVVGTEPPLKQSAVVLVLKYSSLTSCLST